MTYSIQINKRYKIMLSDSTFKPYRKKPTISIFDAEENGDILIASFHSQEAFEWFTELMLGKEQEHE